MGFEFSEVAKQAYMWFGRTVGYGYNLCNTKTATNLKTKKSCIAQFIQPREGKFGASIFHVSIYNTQHTQHEDAPFGTYENIETPQSDDEALYTLNHLGRPLACTTSISNLGAHPIYFNFQS